ncbi:hypothetical protein PENSTE_c035G08373 [Penicillium steckii]|uniref:Uncharacterized protein n=1 Tax=Penicillium steckii TaxID=303698 RepID=A0A1V6SL71_9EURO|nr:hypothetical protein PENSTE_c035G08373 [Penicillium steckii]
MMGAYASPDSDFAGNSQNPSSDIDWEDLEHQTEDFTEDLSREYLSNLPSLPNQKVEDSIAKKWAKWLKKDKDHRRARWAAHLSTFRARQTGSRWRNSRFMRMLHRFGSYGWRPGLDGTDNYQITEVEDVKPPIKMGDQVLKSTSVTLQLGQGKPTKVDANLKCDPYNEVCQMMLFKFSPSVQSMLENVMEYLVAPMAVQYPGVTMYPKTITLDIRLENSFDRRSQSAPHSTTNYRSITIYLPYIERLAQSSSEEVVWREIMASITHEVTHVFQWYHDRAEIKEDKAVGFGSQLSIWPFSKPYSLSINGFRVLPSVSRELLEGIADYVVLRSGLEKSHWKRPISSTEMMGKWRAATYHKAFFLEWLEMRFGEGTVSTLMGLALDSGYSESCPDTMSACGLEFGIWEYITGMGIEDLWGEYGRFVDQSPLYPGAKATWARLYFGCFIFSLSYLICRDQQWVAKTWNDCIALLARKDEPATDDI